MQGLEISPSSGGIVSPDVVGAEEGFEALNHGLENMRRGEVGWCWLVVELFQNSSAVWKRGSRAARTAIRLIKYAFAGPTGVYTFPCAACSQLSYWHHLREYSPEFWADIGGTFIQSGIEL